MEGHWKEKKKKMSRIVLNVTVMGFSQGLGFYFLQILQVNARVVS
jgi:hypothetical protein